VEAIVSDGKNDITRKRASIKLGENKVEWQWDTAKHPFGKYECIIRVLDTKGAVLVSGKSAFEIVNSPTLDELDRVEARMEEFNDVYDRCKAAGIRLDYPTVAKTTIEQFLPLAREDVRNGYEYRAKWMVDDFNNSIDDAILAMQLYMADPKIAPVVKRYQTGKVDIDGVSFIGDRVDSFGTKDRGPLFFCGYGHFGQVRTDIPRFPGYGVNIIQLEIGPSALFPAENKVDLSALKNVCKVLDDAAKHNIMVNVLLSPHYFPNWALAKWPHLVKGGGGYLGYCVDAPEEKQVVEKFIKIVVPAVKNKPALHSICLTNEPVFIKLAN
jgi:hypothetical protein